MLYRIIDAGDVPSLIRAFMDSYELVAPVECDQGHIFDTVDDPNDVVLDYSTTIASAKKYFLPPREVLFKFDVAQNDVDAYELDVKPRVLFGVHPCDMNAIEKLDSVFLEGPYPDPYYRARREATLIVGVGCTPSQSCFCHRMDADEAPAGYDLFLQDLGDRFWVSISSVAAAEVLKNRPRCVKLPTKIAPLSPPPPAAATRHSLPTFPLCKMLPCLWTRITPFVWAELGSRCLNCTACASVCPTCMCFDIVDELAFDGKTGERVREWDCCTNPQFATVAGGHNFRPSERERVRHRMYHKLNGFKEKHGSMLCVGCGRCVDACKTGINPIEVLKFFDQKTRGAHDAQQGKGATNGE